MFKYYIIIFILELPLNIIAQEKYDYSWLLGYRPNQPNNNNNGGTLLSFHNSEPDTAYYEIAFDLTSGNSQISAETGLPLIYTNGCRIAKYPNNTLQAGDGLNPGELRDIWCNENTTDFYDTDQGMVTLPWPGREEEYVLFHLAWTQYQQIPIVRSIDRLYFTHIDMKQNNGQGMVTDKNHLLLTDTFMDNLTAVRHGNGRDWWLVQPRRGSDVIFLFLLQPDGIGGPFVRETGLPTTGQLYTFGQAVFSPDGARYVKVNSKDGIDVLVFDRCKGTFSCPVRLPFPRPEGGASGAAISPNSRYLYVSATTLLFQYDLWAKDIESTKALVGEYDGFSNPFAATFYQQMLAPNGKIYMSATNSQRYLHVIHRPDSFGVDCDFRQHDLLLPSQTGFTVPNFPHFRLYDLPFSPCDTAGVDAPPGYEVLWVPTDGIRLLPNPTSDRTTVTLPPCSKGALRVYTVTGILLEEHPVQCEKDYELSSAAWPAGVYIVAYAPSDGHRPLSAKLVVAR